MMRILIIDQCSGSKDVPENAPEFDVAEIDQYDRESLIEREGVPALPAKQLYTGRQQRYIDSAVAQLREAGDTVDRMYISAGFGLVSEKTPLPPYNVTFSNMTAAEIDERAVGLDIPDAVREAVSSEQAYDIVILALGCDYYRSCGLPAVLESIPDETIGVVFNQDELAGEHENVISVLARTAQAKEYGTIVVAIKGLYIQNFAAHRGTGATVKHPDELIEYLTSEPTTQTGLGDYG
jgi:hypothetical protein